MVSVTTTAALPLLPILQRAFPEIISYNVEDTIVQASADGFRVTTASSSNNNDNISNGNGNGNDNGMELFVKCVEASKYSSRPWGDLRRALLYSRTEARFYSDILPMLRENLLSSSSSPSSDSDSAWDIAPKCYLAESNLVDLIDESESTAAKKQSKDDGNGYPDPKYDINNDAILRGKGGNLVLESLSSTNTNAKYKYYQTSPLSISQASQCLSAAAKFHAAAFENEDILQAVSTKLCENGGSYHLKNRNPKELEQLQQTWDDIVSNIEDASPSGFFEVERIRNIGQRIYNVAEYVSEQLSPKYNEKFATIVHGDYKAMNVFLPLVDKDHNNDNDDDDDINNGYAHEPLLIDFASVGVGIGASDIAMHIPHAVHPTDLDNGGEEQLIQQYIQVFHDALPPHKRELYSKEEIVRHYQFATVDYFRFIVGRMWKGLNMDVFEKRRNLKNFAEFNRTLEAALAFIVRADKYLARIEEEMEQKSTDTNTCSNDKAL
mmetsp:Transcript_5458/g.8115  ORF Transcript_5458/g.8115 Transcript_5458/m.8115 type:complete len:493 (+) Transcript_5458:31-1509(+)